VQVAYPLILRSASKKCVSKDEAAARASWFETAFGLLTMRREAGARAKCSRATP
jgi:hypothetical protein